MKRLSINYKKLVKRTRIKAKAKLMTGSLLLLPTLALAGPMDNGFELQSILQGLIQFLNGTIARTIFVLAIIGVGYGWLYMGSIPKNRAIGAIVGIGIVFSASYIAQQLGVSS